MPQFYRRKVVVEVLLPKMMFISQANLHDKHWREADMKKQCLADLFQDVLA
jgi:hypothetical protein